MSDEFDDAIERASERASRNHPAPSWPAPRRVQSARLITRLYTGADASLRARMLACLLRPLSPLGIVAVAAGAFAGFVHRGGDSDSLRVALEDVGRYSNEQIFELARFVEQVSPDALQQVANLIADNPVGIAAFSASVAMLLLRLLRRHATPRRSS